MDHKEFREELQAILKEKLPSELEAVIEKSLEDYRQLQRYFSALDRKENTDTSLFEQLSGIFGHLTNALADEGRQQWTSEYLWAVDRILENIPEEVTWDQSEERFTTLDTDSVRVSVGKRAKRLARAIGRSMGFVNSNKQSWQHRVPLRRIVAYHLLDKNNVGSWLHLLERCKMQQINAIDDMLFDQRKSETGPEWSTFLTQLQERLEAGRATLLQKLENELEIVETEILNQAEKVGTFEISGRKYSNQRLTYRRKVFIQTLQKYEEEWLRIQQLLLDRTKEIARFLKVRNEIQQQSKIFGDDLSTQFREKMEERLQSFLSELDKAYSELQQGDVLHNVEALQNRLQNEIEQKLLEVPTMLLEKSVLSRKSEHFFDNLLTTANSVSEKVKFLFNIDLEQNPPEINHREIEWRLLVVRGVREQIINPLQPQQQEYEEFLSEYVKKVREIEDIMEINLESSVASVDQEAEEEVEKPAKIAEEALRRISAKVEELHTSVQEKRQNLEESLDKGRRQFSEALLGLLSDGDSKELQILNAKYRVQETTKDWKTVLDSRIAKIQDRLMLWFRFGWKKVKQFVRSIRQFLGFKEPKVEEMARADIASYLSETDQKMKELPYIYRRLFNFDAEADQRFYVAKMDSISSFKKAYEQWQNSLAATFAVVGEKGSGKSTFLNLTVESEITDEPQHHIELQATIWTEDQLVELLAPKLEISGANSIDDLIGAMTNWEERRVVVLECIQNCYLRNVNGYDAIEKLCYLISETKEQVFWVVSSSRYAWRFLDKTVQLSEYFSHITASDSLDADQIKNVILNRHRSSGFTLNFDAAADTAKSRGYRKLQSDEQEAQEYLQKKYFQQLTELAEGNASVAMIFWIRSIRDFDETYFYIKPLEVTSVEMIEDLSPQVLFALAAFVLHDSISDRDLSRILNLELQESRLLLNRLQSRGLLVKKDEYFSINHLMYRQIVRVLKERNIIHLV